MRNLTLSLVAVIALNACTYGRYEEPTTDDTRPNVTIPTLPTTGTTDPNADADGDGFAAGVDCDDQAPGTYPGAEETCDNVDQNCSGVVDEGIYMCQYSDNDFDGQTPSNGDCDDYNEMAYTGATEECNGFDDNCNGQIDESGTARSTNPCGDVDGDGDGFYADLDCNDTEAGINPSALDVPYDGIDQDCEGGDLTDADGDGFNAVAVGGEDCNDVDPDIYPGHSDALKDCDDATPVGAETDADGDGASVEDGDCNDSNGLVYPAAPELCDSLDNDCDGVIDDNVETVDWYLDVDLDGHGNSIPVPACSAPAGHVAVGDDCNDLNAAIHPGVLEIPYDGIDQDCEGGDLDDVDCDLVDAAHDCDDTDPLRFPGNTEVVGDGIDNDCDDTTVDGAVLNDSDGDGSPDDLDCNDADATIYPGATDILYDAIDQDCDGHAWCDSDGDGHDAIACAAGGDDCDDTDASVNPDEVEIFDNSQDDDCDASTVDGYCALGYSVTTGSFTAPVGSTIVSLSGEMIGNVDGFGWMTWADATPVDMTIEKIGNVVEFEYFRCSEDATSFWHASVTYLDAGGNVHYDCENATFTGTWDVSLDSDPATVSVRLNGLGGCDASW